MEASQATLKVVLSNRMVRDLGYLEVFSVEKLDGLPLYGKGENTQHLKLPLQSLDKIAMLKLGDSVAISDKGDKNTQRMLDKVKEMVSTGATDDKGNLVVGSTGAKLRFVLHKHATVVPVAAAPVAAAGGAGGGGPVVPK